MMVRVLRGRWVLVDLMCVSRLNWLIVVEWIRGQDDSCSLGSFCGCRCTSLFLATTASATASRAGSTDGSARNTTYLDSICILFARILSRGLLHLRGSSILIGLISMGDSVVLIGALI